MSLSLVVAKARLFMMGIEYAVDGSIGCKRLWVFFFNIMATLLIALWLLWTVFGLLGLLFFAPILVGVLFGWQVDGAWKKITKWRR